MAGVLDEEKRLVAVLVRLSDDNEVAPGNDAAQEQAIQTSGEILRDMGGKFWDGTEWKLEVTDEQGQILFALRFAAEEQAILTDPQRGSSAP